MNSFEIIWTKSALNDLDIIIDFISQTSQRTAESVASKILKHTSQLSEFPKSGQVEPTLNNLKFEYRYIIEGHSKIIYRLDKSKIFIERVFDTRQNPDKLKILNS